MYSRGDDYLPARICIIPCALNYYYCYYYYCYYNNYYYYGVCAAVLDIIMSWKARLNMSLHVKLRYILKVVSATVWVIVLPVTYAYSWKNPSGFAQAIKNWFGNGDGSPSLFIIAVLIYLSPNMLSALLFLFPFIRRSLERSDYKIVRFMMWWSQVCEHLCQIISFWFE